AAPDPVDPAPPELVSPTLPPQAVRAVTSKTKRLLRLECLCISSCPSAGGTALLAGCGRLRTGTTVGSRDVFPTDAATPQYRLTRNDHPAHCVLCFLSALPTKTEH